jgi:hypothetical protein
MAQPADRDYRILYDEARANLDQQLTAIDAVEGKIEKREQNQPKLDNKVIAMRVAGVATFALSVLAAVAGLADCKLSLDGSNISSV